MILKSCSSCLYLIKLDLTEDEVSKFKLTKAGDMNEGKFRSDIKIK